MKLLKKYNNYKLLKASSLIESVIAMTIISVCILISLNVYAALLKSNNSIMKYKIEAEKNNILNNLENLDITENETFNFDGFSIEKKIEKFGDIDSLKIMKLSSIHQTDTIQKTFIITTNNE